MEYLQTIIVNDSLGLQFLFASSFKTWWDEPWNDAGAWIAGLFLGGFVISVVDSLVRALWPEKNKNKDKDKNKDKKKDKPKDKSKDGNNSDNPDTNNANEKNQNSSADEDTTGTKK